MQTIKQGSIRNRPRCFKAAALLLVASFAGSAVQAAEGPHPKDSPATRKPGHWFQVGKASWYGRRFQGHKTASGEKFDLNMLTCAHRTLPIGSMLRVTNLGNQKSVMVRVNDRGPVQKGLIVDLSYAAARALGIAGNGTMHVSLQRVDLPEAAELDWPSLGQPGDLIPLR